MKRAMSDTEGGKPIIENDYIKPSEQLRKELQEVFMLNEFYYVIRPLLTEFVLKVREAIEDVIHPNPTLEPPTLSLKHQTHLIRRSMQLGNAAPPVQSVEAPPGSIKRKAPRASVRYSIGRAAATGVDAMRRNGSNAPLSVAPLAAADMQPEEHGQRLWDLHSEEDISKAIENEEPMVEEAPEVLAEITNDVIDLAALESVECDNPLLQGYTDEKLTRFKEVEELYGEIMRTNKRVHLDPMETEEEDSFACPAAPIDPQMLNSWLWQGLADPSTLPVSTEKALVEAPRVISAGPFIRLRTRDAHSAYEETPPLHPDDFIRNRSHAMARTLSSRYNGALRYNYGGYIPGDVDTKGTARIMTEPTVEDYTTFLRGRHTDFVFDLIYHEDELAEKRRKAQEEADRVRKIEEDMKRLEQERKERAEQRRQMLSYERGEWNPKIMDFIAELHDASIMPATTPAADEVTEPGSAARTASRQSIARLSVMKTPTVAESLPQTPQSLQTPFPPGTASTSTSPGTAEAGPQAPVPVQPPRPISVDIRQMQEELEILWVRLKMPLDQKLDMAIKYGGHRFGPKLETAIRLWKTASQHIITREELLKEIEAFERTASDPERFFQKGPEGSSAARLKEAKDREDLMRRLHFIEARITDVITNIKLELKESVTYEGAPYKEKMKSDYTEMIKRLHRDRLNTSTAVAIPNSVPQSRGAGGLWQHE
ncbi:Coiled-coil domain-containing protein 87 [Geranomyces michiganensis]|nr:Coiled-coil domain-containing protein 87 [Geranomyces michiganensis]